MTAIQGPQTGARDAGSHAPSPGAARTSAVAHEAPDGPSSNGTWKPGAQPSLARKAARTLRWLPTYAWQRVARRHAVAPRAHVIIAVADHYEPWYLPRLLNVPTSESEQEARVERWCRLYAKTADALRDRDGFPFMHTYFLPAEDSFPAVVERLAAFSRAGFGEVEVQLHHGVWAPDTPASTRATLEQFRDTLVAHGCLSRWNGQGPARYGFVHGNWAIANSCDGRYCGVDEEMQILAETGCYADFTLPSAPSDAQTSKINDIYEPGLPLSERAPHRRGRNLAVGRPPTRWPIIVQGPLGLYLPREAKRSRFHARIDNGEISGVFPPTPERLENWRRSAITVRGRQDWVFVKLHCHGLGEEGFESMIGPQRREFLQSLTQFATERGDTLHYVSARELVNIALAACDGRTGNPSDYRDYRLKPITPRA